MDLRDPLARGNANRSPFQHAQKLREFGEQNVRALSGLSELLRSGDKGVAVTRKEGGAEEKPLGRRQGR
jgi:hypothetical protein